MAFFEAATDDRVQLLRTDPNEPLGTHSPHGFLLDGHRWLSVEHYVQAMKFNEGAYFESIRDASHPAEATRLGTRFFAVKRRDWKKNRIVYMTRAVYTKCRTHPEIAERLLATAPQKIVECSQYDYFWGCGRDGRGDNHYGQVLENVRQKLLDERGGDT